jgi:hypothetical protein
VVSGHDMPVQKLMEENVFGYFDALTHASLLTTDLKRSLCASKIDADVPLAAERRNATVTINLR